ncbi:DNA gyrase/topoisomerase IV subunit A [Rossellomorea marisflavi]|uniref:DNA gyrase/topoisomerase IV subunit A n=1 Tax=Rossellomorea marisflavi TaxID=189381 RepID=UPI003FA08458
MPRAKSKTKETKPVTIEENIIDYPYEDEMKTSYLDYSMSVILSRALPDARDGLKPVHRRILYGMKEMGVTHEKPHKKSARIVGQVLGLYHPHGDSSVYNAMVRLSQLFKVRIPLVDGHGNFGSIDGDSPAAMRYTEARLSEQAQFMLQDLEKGLVDMKENFDASEQEPVVLPALIPQLYMNGTSGIAVGMRTSIPPHNPTELVEAVQLKLKKPKASLDDLLTIVKGPDFPTGGVIVNQKELRSIYESGQGKAIIRSKIEVEPGQYGKTNLIVTEIPFPYSGNKEKLVTDIINLVNDKKITELTDVRDESSKDGIRIFLEVRKGVDVDKLLHKLYRLTGLQEQESYQCLALVDGKPKMLGLSEYLDIFIKFQKEIYTKKYQYLLPKAHAKRELLEGLMGAIPVIESIIEVVRGSSDIKQMKDCLMTGNTDGITFSLKKNEKTAKAFHFTERQAQAILDMKLQKLGRLERLQLEQEYDALSKEINFYEEVLSDEKKLVREINKVLNEFKKKFGNARMTDIVNQETKVFKKEVKIEDVSVQLDKFGYVKILEGAPDKTDTNVRETFEVKSNDRLVVMTSDGMAVQLKVEQIPRGKAKDKGKPLQVLTAMDKTEAPLFVYPLSEIEKETVLFMTKQGMTKRVEGKEFTTNRASIVAHKLEEEDKIAFAGITTDAKTEIVLESNDQKVLRFKASEIPLAKRNAKGVVAMKLKDGDYIRTTETIIPSKKSIQVSLTNKTLTLDEIELSKRARSGKVYK